MRNFGTKQWTGTSASANTSGRHAGAPNHSSTVADHETHPQHILYSTSTTHTLQHMYSMVPVLPLDASPVRAEEPPLMLLKPGELTKRRGGDLPTCMQHATIECTFVEYKLIHPDSSLMWRWYWQLHAQVPRQRPAHSHAHATVKCVSLKHELVHPDSELIWR